MKDESGIKVYLSEGRLSSKLLPLSRNSPYQEMESIWCMEENGAWKT
jgi:hypothetical protein